MKKRIFFDKYGEMRFISHLDMLRFADRLLKKAHIPMKYSQGFHPRPKISLGNPVSLGTEAFNEIMDIELSEMMTNEEVMEKMNSAAVPGFRVNKVEDIVDKKSIVDTYTNAVFEITGDKKNIDILEELFNREEIIERKEKNGKISERNLGERVKAFSRVENTINLELVNTSPNSFLILAGVDVKDVHIVKKGYKN
ncbi:MULTISPECIES: TIGR03936 family radical SAM-associated protein [Cetobacterium]|jgi:radical SAM-linked protein|uniref:TIGR03936 family radical SAM-associated protein n=1 Tax=Candidatus Cetobacterium colombiensis TaxID=3073100 RepID=A0ABU4WB58_9FUSO|nr:TIGR03936 family radical SAM-associated protein [Candidatus Cetobacterium colombiensis]MDX8336262.1 TIGR03936 family radical SAM-associated protein [Candidatus Cetobacterium colombiensis]